MALRIYGNRQLKTVPGQATRPTTGRVREALFNIWQASINGSTWLDLCAGNGVMGAEALCRGASMVIGIEQSGIACRTIEQNWKKVAKVHQAFSVIRGDVRQQLSKLSTQPFQHIYFDPPYHAGLYEAVLTAIAQHHLLSSEGELAVEHDVQWTASNFPGLALHRQKQYGRTVLSFYMLASTSCE
ncbi:MAG: 16S rRNA (guanine(966)-N(2))-methyltransferase RsmD [Leptolyngbyaceae cyanobacterium]